jgi:hypothetical protein
VIVTADKSDSELFVIFDRVRAESDATRRMRP